MKKKIHFILLMLIAPFLSFAQAPVNDDPNNAIAIVPSNQNNSPTVVTGTLNNATNTVDATWGYSNSPVPCATAPCPAGMSTVVRDVWYKFNSGSNTSLSINISNGTGTSLASHARLFSTTNCAGVAMGAPFNSVNCICGSSINPVGNALFSLTPNTCYFLAITTKTGTNPSPGTTFTFSSAFSPFILPVKINYLKGEAHGSINILEWEVGFEENFSHYEIEKYNKFLDTYELLGKIYGDPNSKDIKKYNFTDNKVQFSKEMYRIKSVDIDGAYIFSNVLEIYNDSFNNKFAIYPNPVNDELTVFAQNDIVFKNTNYKIINLYGQTLLSNSINNTKKHTIALSNLQAGMYELVFENEQGLHKHTFIKK